MQGKLYEIEDDLNDEQFDFLVSNFNNYEQNNTTIKSVLDECQVPKKHHNVLESIIVECDDMKEIYEKCEAKIPKKLRHIFLDRIKRLKDPNNSDMVNNINIQENASYNETESSK